MALAQGGALLAGVEALPVQVPLEQQEVSDGEPELRDARLLEVVEELEVSS